MTKNYSLFLFLVSYQGQKHLFFKNLKPLLWLLFLKANKKAFEFYYTYTDGFNKNEHCNLDFFFALHSCQHQILPLSLNKLLLKKKQKLKSHYITYVGVPMRIITTPSGLSFGLLLQSFTFLISNMLGITFFFSHF